MVQTKYPGEGSKWSEGKLSVRSHVANAAAFEFNDAGTHLHTCDFSVMETYCSEYKVIAFFFKVFNYSAYDCPSKW